MPAPAAVARRLRLLRKSRDRPIQQAVATVRLMSSRPALVSQALQERLSREADASRLALPRASDDSSTRPPSARQRAVCLSPPSSCLRLGASDSWSLFSQRPSASSSAPLFLPILPSFLRRSCRSGPAHALPLICTRLPSLRSAQRGFTFSESHCVRLTSGIEGQRLDSDEIVPQACAVVGAYLPFRQRAASLRA